MGLDADRAESLEQRAVTGWPAAAVAPARQVDECVLDSLEVADLSIDRFDLPFRARLDIRRRGARREAKRQQFADLR